MLARLSHLVLAVSLLAPLAARAESSKPAAPTQAAEPILAPPGAPDRAEVRAALAERREHNLASFRAYAKAGIYPHNSVRPGPLNVWRDADGHLCAAATMIDRDGQHDLVAKTALDNNKIRLLDVTSGPLMDWILTSGLTLEEIDRIQAPMIMPDPSETKREAAMAREDAKLHKGYDATSAYLAKHAKEDLDVATDRLMANPALAESLFVATTDV